MCAVKYFGILTDDKLTWLKQVDVIVKKCSQQIGLFKKLLPYFTNDIVFYTIMLYQILFFLLLNVLV